MLQLIIVDWRKKNKMIPESELNALVKLLHDPDEAIYNQVKSRLLELGPDVIPSLESAWESLSIDIEVQHRIEELIHEINFNSTKVELQSWIEGGSDNLLRGAIIVSKYQYPDLDEGKILSRMAQIKQDIWIELNDDLTPLEITRVINHILFDIHKFSGNKKDFHAPQNSYINNVLDTHKGNPLSLSIIYSHIAQLLDLPIKGVNLPSHFVLGYQDELGTMKIANPEEEFHGVLFYINPFSRGTIFNKQEITSFLKQIELEPKKEFYSTCSNTEMVKRTITNLIYSYEKLGYPDKVEELKELINLF